MPNRPPTHKPPRTAAPDGRPSAAARGYDWRWRKRRLEKLMQDPLCQHCHTAAATDVDHVVRKRGLGGSDDLSNLESLCHSCHARKTCRTDHGFGRKPKE